MKNSTLIKMKVYDNTQLEFHFVDIDLSSNSSLLIYNFNYLLLKLVLIFFIVGSSAVGTAPHNKGSREVITPGKIC